MFERVDTSMIENQRGHIFSVTGKVYKPPENTLGDKMNTKLTNT